MSLPHVVTARGNFTQMPSGFVAVPCALWSSEALVAEASGQSEARTGLLEPCQVQAAARLASLTLGPRSRCWPSLVLLFSVPVGLTTSPCAPENRADAKPSWLPRSWRVFLNLPPWHVVMNPASYSCTDAKAMLGKLRGQFRQERNQRAKPQRESLNKEVPVSCETST